MHQRQQLGELIDSLGVAQRLADDELVEGAVVLLKVVDDDGEVTLRAAWSDGMSWIERIGMLRAAERCELPAEGANSWRSND